MQERGNLSMQQQLHIADAATMYLTSIDMVKEARMEAVSRLQQVSGNVGMKVDIWNAHY